MAQENYLGVGAADAMCESTKKNWRRPELRKLPIAATASNNKSASGNEGNGNGKGDANSPLS